MNTLLFTYLLPTSSKQVSLQQTKKIPSISSTYNNSWCTVPICFFGWIHEWMKYFWINFAAVSFHSYTDYRIKNLKVQLQTVYIICKEQTHLSLALKTVPNCLPSLTLVSLDWAHLSSYFCFSLSPDRALTYVCLLKLYPSFTIHSKNLRPIIFSILSTP